MSQFEVVAHVVQFETKVHISDMFEGSSVSHCSK